MEIRIEDYLTRDEMKDIARNEFKELLKNGRERILSNLTYYLGEGFVKSLITKEELSKLEEETVRHLQDTSCLKSFIYEKPDAWGHIPTGDLVVYDEVQKTIKENVHLVRENIIKELDNLNLDSFSEEFDIGNLIYLLIQGVKNDCKS